MAHKPHSDSKHAAPKFTVPAACFQTSPPANAKANGQAVVVAVPSGDSLVLKTQAGETKTVYLSGIQAPRVGRSRTAVDEPFSFDSREFLRRRCIGQKVTYYILPTNTAGEYATVYLANNENIAYTMVAVGLATVRRASENDPLTELEESAKAAGLGIHSDLDPEIVKRIIDWNPERAFFDKFKLQKVVGVIDQVRDGNLLRVELVPDMAHPYQHTMVNLYLAGVSCPRMPSPVAKDEETPKEVPTPEALAAQKCVEEKLLHRDVYVVLQGFDSRNNFFGTIVHPAGNISLYLLEQGFGQLVPWSAQLTGQTELYNKAQSNAQKARVRMWKDFVPQPGQAKDTKSDDSFTVVQVVSGDTLVVRDNRGKEQKVFLASIRAPRMAAPKAGIKEEPYAFEAREHLRRRIGGKRITMTVDYVRKPTADQKDQVARTHVSIYDKKQNIGELLVRDGLAEVVKHRSEDPRAIDYHLLCEAEEEAKSGKRGKFSSAKPPVHNIVDLSERFGGPAGGDEKASNKQKQLSGKARQFLIFLQKEAKQGVVEHVFNGSRFKVWIPSENCIVSLSLSGVKAPAPMGKENKPDPLGELALQYSRLNTLQQNVTVEVETIDKGDNFIGALFLGKVNLAVNLAAEGLAEVVPFSAEKSRYKEELFKAEAEAKKARKGIWKNWVEPKVEATAVVEKKEEKVFTDDKGFVKVTVTEIIDGARFYAHIVNDKAVAAMESKMASFSEEQDEKSSANFNPKKGTICAGQFDDGNYCRVRIDAVRPDNQFVCFFIDYGNSSTIEGSFLLPLPPALASIPPLAHECVLAALKAPSQANEFFEEAMEALHSLVWERELLAKVELQDSTGRLHVTLLDPENELSINSQLLEEGYLRIQAKAPQKLAAVVEAQTPHQSLALRQHKRIWRHGDVSDEDEAPKGDWRDEGGAPRKKPVATKDNKAAPAKPAKK